MSAATDRERFEQGLPWFVNGTLAPDDAAWMRRQADREPWARAMLAREAALVRAAAAQLAPPPAGDLGLALLMARVGAPAARPPRLRHRLAAWLGRPPFALATAALVVLQFGAVLVLSLPAERELTRGGGAAATVRLRFAPGATEAEARDALRRAGARIVRGPGAAGDYWVTSEVYTPDELAAALKRSPVVADAARDDTP